MGHSAVHEHLQTLRRWYKVKRREAPPSQPTCSSGALRSVGCFGCANSRLSSVIAQKQMCAKYRTLPNIHFRFCFPVSLEKSEQTQVECLSRNYSHAYGVACAPAALHCCTLSDLRAPGLFPPSMARCSNSLSLVISSDPLRTVEVRLVLDRFSIKT